VPIHRRRSARLYGPLLPLTHLLESWWVDGKSSRDQGLPCTARTTISSNHTLTSCSQEGILGRAVGRGRLLLPPRRTDRRGTPERSSSLKIKGGCSV
jgi:hypothetical protein